VLGDAARFLVDEIGGADGVEQGRLAVVDMAHDGDDRRSRRELRGPALGPQAHGLVEGDEFGVEVGDFGDDGGELRVDEFVEVGGEAPGGEFVKESLGLTFMASAASFSNQPSRNWTLTLGLGAPAGAWVRRRWRRGVGLWGGAVGLGGVAGRGGRASAEPGTASPAGQAPRVWAGRPRLRGPGGAGGVPAAGLGAPG